MMNDNIKNILIGFLFGITLAGVIGFFKFYDPLPNPAMATANITPIVPINDADNFNYAVNFLLSNEGGYSNLTQDKGGATNFGITTHFEPGVDIKALTREDAIKIYKSKYWDGTQIPFINDNFLRTKFFDTSILMGYHAATILLQRALQATGLEVLDDGIFGKKTLKNVNECKNSFGLQWAFIAHISNYIKDIVERDPTQKVFLQGWMARIHDVVGD